EEQGDVWLPKKGKQKAPPIRAKTPPKAAKVKHEPKPKVQRVHEKEPGTSKLPRKVKPMIPTLSHRPVDKKWIVEPRVDGLRAIAEVENKRVSLYSKAGLSFNGKFADIVDELKDFGV